MINSRKDLLFYLKKDKEALKINRIMPFPLSDEVWRYQIILRMREYFTNTSGLLHPFLSYLFKIMHHRMGIKLGFLVPINVCDYGLRINHWGLLIISCKAIIGKNFNVHQGVNIGENVDPDKAPIIGDNVFCGPGVKIYGGVRIANNIAIAAGSVVTRSFTTPNVTIGGVPARVINPDRGNPFVSAFDSESSEENRD